MRLSPEHPLQRWNDQIGAYDWEPYIERARAKPGRRVKAGVGIARSRIVSARAKVFDMNLGDKKGQVRLSQANSRPDPLKEGDLIADVYFIYEKEDR